VLSVLNNFAKESSIDEFTYRLAYQTPVLSSAEGVLTQASIGMLNANNYFIDLNLIRLISEFL